MSNRRNSLIALIIVTLALLIIGILETLLMGAELPSPKGRGAGGEGATPMISRTPPEPIKRAVQEAMKYHDGVVLLWNRRGSEHWVLGNPALLRQNFLPGSLMKLIIAEAALNKGIDLRYRCEGHDGKGRKRRACWLPAGHGPLDLPKALAHSCNLYFSELGSRLGWDPLWAVLERYSLSPKNNSLPKTDVALRNFSIGEEKNFSLTPLQIKDFWEKYLDHLDQVPFQAIREGLERSAREGTAKAGAALGAPILAKTGTAEALGEPYKTHGWFVGAVPAQDPEWAVVIFMKNAHGYREPAQLAGTIFKEIISAENPRPLTPAPLPKRGEGSQKIPLAPRRGERGGSEGACSFSIPKSVRVQNKESGLISTIPLEDYVATVLASEMPESFPLEALKAQAVLARTLAINSQQNHRSQGFDFCDTTHCQLFRPAASIPEKFRIATRETRGQTLNYDRQPITVLYHSSCGGHTSPNQRVFGGEPLPYLKGVDDRNFCGDSPQNRWESRLERRQLEQALNFSPMERMKIFDGEAGGRSFGLILEGRNSKEISTQSFLQQVGKKMGWEKIKSAYFVVEPQGDALVFRGRGLGHGVGLCQWGSRGMALHGKNYREILQHYFPGTQVGRTPSPPPLSPNRERGAKKFPSPPGGGRGAGVRGSCGPNYSSTNSLHPFDEISRNPQYQKQLEEIVRQAVSHNFGTGNTITQPLPSPFEKPVGLFVTAKKNGEVLGCMGTIQPQQARLADEIFFNLQKAFSQDPRHRPVSQNQLNDMEIFLTAVERPERVQSIETINPAKDSILLRHGSKEAVVLAGEARTLRYMLALAKAKAGLQTGDSFQIYRLSTKILILSL